MNLKNNHGFALAFLLAILPVFIAGLVFCFSSFGFVQNDLAMKYQCRVEGRNGQKEVAPLLTGLLALNPLAVRLRAEWIQALYELWIALASENPGAIAAATKKCLVIKEKRGQLDQKQKQLIRQSNLLLQKSHLITKQKLFTTAAHLSNIFLKFDLVSLRGKAPRLAVRPDSADVAPTYGPVADFNNEQALAHEWQYQVSVRSPYSQFLPGIYSFKKACAVTLEKERISWVPKIIRGRFLLKSLW